MNSAKKSALIVFMGIMCCLIGNLLSLWFTHMSITWDSLLPLFNIDGLIFGFVIVLFSMIMIFVCGISEQIQWKRMGYYFLVFILGWIAVFINAWASIKSFHFFDDI